MCVHGRENIEVGGGELWWRVQCDHVRRAKWKLAAEIRVYRGVSFQFDARRGQLTRGQVSTSLCGRLEANGTRAELKCAVERCVFQWAFYVV